MKETAVMVFRNFERLCVAQNDLLLCNKVIIMKKARQR